MAIMEVKGMIADLFRLVKVKRSIESHDEAEMIAALIVSEYWDLRISELQYIFRGIVTGRYGKVFDRLDANTICQFIREYQTSLERITYDEARASQHKAKRSEDELAMAYHEYRSSLAAGEQPLSYRDWFYQIRCKPVDQKPRKPKGREYFYDGAYLGYKRRREEMAILEQERKSKTNVP